MRTLSVLALLALLALSAPALGQPCPNGQCPVPQRGVVVQQPQQWAFPQSVGQYPVQQCGPQGCFAAPQQFVGPPVVQQQPRTYPYQDVEVIDGVPRVITVTGFRDVDVPQVMPSAKPIPAAGDDQQAAGAGKRERGRLFYLVVRNRAEDRLVEKGVSRDEAKRMVAGLSDPGIDGLADQCQIARGIGDGRLLDWILEHKEQIKALIEFIVSLLLLI